MTEEEQKRELAIQLHKAWTRYMHVFGETVHGTLKQLSAMVELIPDKSVFLRTEKPKRKPPKNANNATTGLAGTESTATPDTETTIEKQIDG